MTNKLNTLLCSCLLLFTAASAQKKTEWVTLKGELKNFSNQVQVEDLSEFQYLLPPTNERMIVPDAKSLFNIRFKLSKPNYFRLGRNILYLSPGDDMEIVVDYRDQMSAVFKGRGAEANVYLKSTPFPKGGSFIEAGSQVKESPEATIIAVEAQADIRRKELANTKNITAEFRRLEHARIKADLINSFYSGEDYSIYHLKLKDEQAKEFSLAYQKAIAPKLAFYNKNFVDASLMKLVVYRDIASDLIKNGGKTADLQSINDWYNSYSMVKAIQKVSDKSQLGAFKAKIAAIKTPELRGAVNQTLLRQMAFGKGDTAVDFVAEDISGKQVSLSSLKGKVVYVDLWATWCGPCMKEMPHFEELKLKYKDNPAVVFISLSLDDTATPWKASVVERKADGYQWHINRSKLRDYNIVGIPRSLLIDKDFKMADMNAPMPSETEVVQSIDGLLK